MRAGSIPAGGIDRLGFAGRLRIWFFFHRSGIIKSGNGPDSSTGYRRTTIFFSNGAAVKPGRRNISTTVIATLRDLVLASAEVACRVNVNVMTGSFAGYRAGFDLPIVTNLASGGTRIPSSLACFAVTRILPDTRTSGSGRGKRIWTAPSLATEANLNGATGRTLASTGTTPCTNRYSRPLLPLIGT